jgi:hypothetical protein
VTSKRQRRDIFQGNEAAAYQGTEGGVHRLQISSFTKKEITMSRFFSASNVQ